MDATAGLRTANRWQNNVGGHVQQQQQEQQPRYGYQRQQSVDEHQNRLAVETATARLSCW